MANKYDFYSRYKDCDQTIQYLVSRTVQTLKTKYYNLWMSKFKWNGLDEENREQEQNYIMKKLWCEGKVAMRNIPNTSLLAICPFAEEKLNMYDFADTVTLVDSRGVGPLIIPQTPQIVNKDVALIYCTPGRGSIEWMANYYIDRITQVEVLINNNLKLQSMPFIVACDETDKRQMEDIVSRILNNEIVVYTSSNDLNKLKSLITNAPYIVDKLKSYQVSLENELLTVLGVDNSGIQAKKAQMLVDEVNANNDAINDYGAAIEDEIKMWLERANKVLNRNISIEAKSKPVDSTKDFEDSSITETKETSNENMV